MLNNHIVILQKYMFMSSHHALGNAKQ